MIGQCVQRRRRCVRAYHRHRPLKHRVRVSDAHKYDEPRCVTCGAIISERNEADQCYCCQRKIILTPLEKHWLMDEIRACRAARSARASRNRARIEAERKCSKPHKREVV